MTTQVKIHSVPLNVGVNSQIERRIGPGNSYGLPMIVVLSLAKIPLPIDWFSKELPFNGFVKDCLIALLNVKLNEGHKTTSNSNKNKPFDEV